MNQYLYHYTSIETLALILKNRTIRFNNLQNVDDPEEAETKIWVWLVNIVLLAVGQRVVRIYSQCGICILLG